MTLLIATPIRGAELWSSSVSVGYSEAVRLLSQEMHGVQWLSAQLFFSCEIVRARNRAVAMLLREPDFAGVTHILFWDDDQWPEDRKIVAEMMALNLPIVAAPYTNKRQPLRWVHQSHPPIPGSKDDPYAIDAQGCCDVRAVGMGFTLISRACIETMAHDPRTKWYNDAPSPHNCPNLFGQLYDTLGGQEVLLSEDFSFCKRWREDFGGRVKIYTKAGIVFHAGAHAWSAREKVGGVTG